MSASSDLAAIVASLTRDISDLRRIGTRLGDLHRGSVTRIADRMTTQVAQIETIADTLDAQEIDRRRHAEG